MTTLFISDLHLDAEATVPLVCQRCLSPVETPLTVDRWFRFVADEATAEAEDEDSEEDLLVVSRDFDLHALIEDELLMDIPVTPVHDVCPTPVALRFMGPNAVRLYPPREPPPCSIRAIHWPAPLARVFGNP